MEEYEILKKYFIDKERENLQLKEELNLLRSKIDSSHSSSSDILKSQTIESRKISDILPRTQSDLNFNSSSTLENPDKNEELQMPEKSIYNYLSKSLVNNKGKEKITSVSFNNGTLTEELNQKFVNRQKSELGQSITGFPRKLNLNEMTYQIQNQNSYNVNENNITSLSTNVNSSKETRNSFLVSNKHEKNEDESKGRNSIIQSNKNVIRNIESNISDLKKHLGSYETAYKNMNLNLEINSNESENSLAQKLDYINNELFLKIKSQEIEMKKVKEVYENELNMKNEIYENNIFHLNQTHQDEVRKIRINYENKIDEIIKKSEEEKLDQNKQISILETEVTKYKCLTKNDSNEKNELIEFKKKYIDEMKELQKSFENFKNKTYTEFKILKKTKEEAVEKSKYFQESFEKAKSRNESIHKRFLENSQESKFILKTNDHLLVQLENSKTEYNLLKTKLEKIENMFLNSNNNNISNNIITGSSYKSIQFIQSEMNTLTKEEILEKKEKEFSRLKHVRQTSRCSDLVNYEIPNNSRQAIANCVSKQKDNIKLSRSNLQGSSANVYNIGSVSNSNSDYDEDVETHDSNLKEQIHSVYYNKNKSGDNLYKTVDLKQAHEKIKEMGQSLQYMNDENENLRGKLGYVISNMSNMNNLSVSQGAFAQKHYNIDKSCNYNSANINGKTPSYSNEENNKNKIEKSSSGNNPHRVYSQSPAVVKQKREKNYSTEIYEDMQRQLDKERDVSPSVSKSKKFNSCKEKNCGEEDNGSYRNKLSNSIQVTPFAYEEKKKAVNYRDLSPGEKREDSGKKKQNHESCRKNDDIDFIDDRIIEFPLQIKIKGKIRKIPTGERSSKA